MTTAVSAWPVRALRLRVRGVVQGVGFRPFVHRLARQTGLAGWVRNDSAGVMIHIEGPAASLERMRTTLLERLPPGAAIDALSCEPAEPEGHDTFRILPSNAEGRGVRVPTDRARCDACRREVFDPDDRRFGYPFTTCTKCGPRYSIIAAMPYDRPRTTMAGFPLCPACREEYDDPEHRRFHAQPVACDACGPAVWLSDRSGRALHGGIEAIRAATSLLREGRVLALKGLGGFQLLVRADCAQAVGRLRQHKDRPTKPLAVMVADTDSAARLVRLDAVGRRLLESPENPVVLLDRLAGTEGLLAEAVAPRLHWVGLMLPTTPLHDLLLAELGMPVVATSGNRSEEPIETENDSALAGLANVADGFLLHDRPIHRRVDDSVVRPAAGGPVTIRLARGYAPLPLPHLERWLSGGVSEPVLAVGGQQKAAMALWSGSQAVLSPHVGDLDGAETREAFVKLTREWAELFGCRPARVACDLHPDYFSTRWAEGQGVPLVRVQHHHAHAAAVMVEHGLLDEEVLAFTWDGTGLGGDGTIWGGETLRATLTGFERVAGLRPFPLPGGEAAVREPARVTLALLAQALGEQAVLADADLLRRLGWQAEAARVLLRMASRGVNSPLTSSMGRLFDAAAALLLPVGRVSHEGEAATWLESLADPDVSDGHPVVPGDAAGLLEAVLAELRGGMGPAVIAGRFHQTLAGWAATVARRHPGLPVVLGGGCFQNRLLLEMTRRELERDGRRVFHPRRIPAGDGGLAVGQLAVALALGRGGG